MYQLTSLAITALTAAKRITADDTSAAVDLSDYTGNVLLVLNSSVMEGASQTSDVKLTHCDTSGGTYVDAGIAFDQVTTAGGASHQVKMVSTDGLKKFVKVVNDLGGTSPAVTFDVQIIGKKR